MTTPATAAHQHHCRQCAAAFDCTLANPYCRALCAPCQEDAAHEQAAFRVWWESAAGSAFVREWSEMRSQNQLVTRALAAFHAGWRAAQETR